jgi:transcription elongation factor/antiterminator RfaH
MTGNLPVLNDPRASPGDYVSTEAISVEPCWYAIHTKVREEDRAEINLRSWGLETFLPKRKTRRDNEFTGRPVYFSRSLFPRYMFARFDADKLLHKVRFTRGVNNVVSLDGSPNSIPDEVIDVIRGRLGDDGFVKMDEEIEPGDSVVINQGALKGFGGIFKRSLKDGDRVKILLTSIKYQAELTIEKALVTRCS